MHIRFAGLFDQVPSAAQAGPFQRVAQIHERRLQDGFDSGYGWNRFENIYSHLLREVREFRQAVQRGESPARQQDELGDVLYITTYLGLFQNLNPEQALHHAGDKFIRRFETVSQLAKERFPHRTTASLTPDERRILWEDAKKRLAST